MIQIFDHIGRFLRELRRRNVYKVAVTYLAVAFVALQAVTLLIPATTLPPWAHPFLLALLIVGFPIAVVLAWAFELTPDGVRRTPAAEPRAGAVDGDEEPAPAGGPAAGPVPDRPAPILSRVAGVTLLLALGLGGWYVLRDRGTGEITDRSIAVLPFEAIGGEVSPSFADGIHAGILTRLSTVGDLNVKSRTSVMKYRESAESLPSVARQLGAAWVVRGEVQETGDRLRVTARLVDARSDRNVWAERYERQLSADSLFAIEEEIVGAIAHALQVELGPEERRRIGRRPTSDLDAFRLYVRGRTLLDQRTETAMDRALEVFRQAIRQDSSYALAWVGLADALMIQVSYGHAHPDSVRAEASEAVSRALELDPGSAEAMVSRALLRAAEGNGPGVIRNLHRAVEFRPSYAEAHNLLGWYQPLLGRPQEGLDGARRAVELDPLSPEAWTNVALGYVNTGRPDSALAPARRAAELQPDYSAAPFYEAVALHRLGRLDAAEEILQGLEVDWAPGGPLTTLALVRMAAGDTSVARAALDSMREADHFRVYRGILHAALGDGEAALRSFEEARGWAESALMAWPVLAVRYQYPDGLGALRREARFGEILDRIDRSWGLAPRR